LSAVANRSKGRTNADATKLRESLALADQISPETGEEITIKRGGKEARHQRSRACSTRS